MSCIVKNCTNIRRLMPPNSKINFFSFPREERRFREWLKAVHDGKENRPWSKGILICSNHFRPEDLEFTGVRTRVNQSAVPFVSTSSVGENQTGLKRERSPAEPSLSAPSIKIEKEERQTSSPATNCDTLLGMQSDNILESESESAVESVSSPTKRRNVKLDHPYGISPERARRKSDETEKKLRVTRKELYKAREKIKALKKRVNYLTDILHDLCSD